MNNLKGTTQKKILTKIHKTTTPHNPSAQLELNPSTSLNFLLDRGAFLYPCNTETKVRICKKGATWKQGRILNSKDAHRYHYDLGNGIGLLPKSLGLIAFDIDQVW